MTDTACRNLIKEKKDLATLYEFWKNRKKSDWDSGKAFEYSIIRAFEINGAEVTYPYHNGQIEQIDGVIYANNLCVVVESKDYDSKYQTDIEPLAKLQVRLLRRPSMVIGCIFSATDYTYPAQTLVETLEPKTILLWDKEDIEYCFKKECFIEVLKTKFKKAVETGNHYYKASIKPEK